MNTNTNAMKTNHLLVSELDYELRIRGIVTGRKDAGQKRKMLAKILDKDRGRVGVVLTDPEYNFDNEVEVIDATIESIRAVIADFEGPESDSTCKRVRSRIIHVTERVKRIQIPNNDDATRVTEFKNESLANCLELEVLLDEKITKEPSLADMSVFSNNSNIQPVVNTIVQPAVRNVPVYKWNIHFNGDRNSDLIAFLDRVEELRASRHIEKKELFESAVELFSGNALLWFRSIKPTVHDWDSLVALLKSEFLPADYVDHVWDKIRNRFQTSSEPVHIYIASMENLFAQLGQYVAESTKVKYIKKNLLAHFVQQLALFPINSVRELSIQCKKIEETVCISRSNRSLVNRVASVGQFENMVDSKTFKNKNFKHSVGNSDRYTVFEKNYRLSLPGPSNSYMNASKQVTCWNCNQPNHTHRDCKARRNVFCYRCGRPRVTSKTCGCSKN